MIVYRFELRAVYRGGHDEGVQILELEVPVLERWCEMGCWDVELLRSWDRVLGFAELGIQGRGIFG